MPFQGSGLYEIIPYQAPKLSLNSQGGGTQPGEKVKLGDRWSPPGGNTVWQVALAKGQGSSSEWIILNVRSGYYLTNTAAQSITSCERRSPDDPAVRFKIREAFTNGYDVWTINSVVDNLGQLNVSGSGTTSGTDILTWPTEDGDNTKFYFDPVTQYN